MLKRIEAHQLSLGMFIEAIEGSALHDDVLKRHRFMLRQADVLHQLKASNASAFVINTTKGLDVSTSAESGRVDTSRVDDSRSDAATALQTVQHASVVLHELFANAQIGRSVSMDEAAPVVAEISKAIYNNASVFLGITRLKTKDETTFVHSISVSALMIHFGNYLGFDERTIELLGVGGLLHDIGKVEVPNSILNKNGSLTDGEMDVIRTHPELGHAILSRQAGMPDIVLDICRNHHERVDGRGYPDRAKGNDISIYARIAAICDVYDAVTSVRSYHKPWSAGAALTWMLKREGQFDRKLLRRFALCLSSSLVKPVSH